MKMTQVKRNCIWCKKTRRTTNKESPYIDEICLRSAGRNLLLRSLQEDEFEEKTPWWMFWK